MTIKLKDILEGIGDFAGAASFQGGPFGYGRQRQLAKPDHRPELDDPANKHPEGGFNKPELDYDDRPHLLPHEDETLREPYLLNTEDVVTDPGRSNYHDYKGFPRMNTLVDPEPHIPSDQDPAREYPEDVKDNVRISLVPTGNDAEPDYWGYGSLDDPPSGEPDGYGNTLKLQGNPAANDWMSTTLGNRGDLGQSPDVDQLVRPHDYFRDLDSGDDLNMLDDEDDVVTRPGTVATTSAPRKMVPDNKESVSRFVRKVVHETLMEKAPPGMEDDVMALKKKYGENNPKVFAIAWGQYNRRHKS